MQAERPRVWGRFAGTWANAGQLRVTSSSRGFSPTSLPPSLALHCLAEHPFLTAHAALASSSSHHVVEAGPRAGQLDQALQLVRAPLRPTVCSSSMPLTSSPASQRPA